MIDYVVGECVQEPKIRKERMGVRYGAEMYGPKARLSSATQKTSA